ncbi:gamma-glutamylcyclotransferase [Clostridia bacterium]|nr:gamma-glutamylcyclotransferase [Clostridia bacterium]
MRKAGKLYVAYGSNMNMEQMSRRCPTAMLVGRSELSGYKLLFRGSTSNAVATVEPVAGVATPVLVWRLQPEDEAMLDMYEGYPNFYRKETVRVLHNGKMLDAMIYIMNDGRSLGRPCAEYFAAIRKGYTDAGFDVGILREAVLNSVNGDK